MQREQGKQEAEPRVETKKAVESETSGRGNADSFHMPRQQEFSELLGKYLAYL